MANYVQKFTRLYYRYLRFSAETLFKKPAKMSERDEQTLLFFLHENDDTHIYSSSLEYVIPRIRSLYTGDDVSIITRGWHMVKCTEVIAVRPV